MTIRLRVGTHGDDLPAMAELRNRCSEADGVEEVFTVEALENDRDHAVGWDPARDQFVAEVDGTLAGWSTASIHAAQTGEQILEANVRVDPALRGRGIGRALLRAAVLGLGTIFWPRAEVVLVPGSAEAAEPAAVAGSEDRPESKPPVEGERS